MAKAKSKEPEVEVVSNVKQSWKSWKGSKNDKGGNMSKGNGGGGHAVYILGFIGSLVYWLQAAVGFGAIITAFLKSLLWPAYIVYKFLESFYGITG